MCAIFCLFRLSSLLSLLGTYLTSRTAAALLTCTHTCTGARTYTDTHVSKCHRGDDVNETQLGCQACLFAVRVRVRVRLRPAPLVDAEQVYRATVLDVCQEKEYTNKYVFALVGPHTFSKTQSQAHKCCTLQSGFCEVIWAEIIWQFCPSHYHRLSLLCLICTVLSTRHKSFISL